MATVIGDAFGELLRRCWAEGAATGIPEVVERDDGLVSHGDARRYFQGPEFWPVRETALLGSARGRVLDIGCGAGRHMAALRELGVSAVGVDPSPGAVAVCRERGLTAEVGDIERLPGGPYDTLLLLGGGLALLGSPAAASRRLAAMAAVAGPGALVLGSNLDPYHTIDPRHTGYHAENRRRGRASGQLRVRVRHGGTVTDWVDYWLASVAELETVVAQSPWRLDHVDGGRAGDPFYTVVLALR